MIWLSLPLGLLACLLPLLVLNWDLSHKRRFAMASALCCALALLNVLWEVLQRVQSGDLSGLSDLADFLILCSLALVLGTLLLNLLLLRKPGTKRIRVFRWSPSGFQQLMFVLLLAAASFVTLILIILFFQDSLEAWKPANSETIDFLRGNAVPLAHSITLIGLIVYLKNIPMENVHWTLPLGFALSPFCIQLDLVLSHLAAYIRSFLGNLQYGPYEWGRAENELWIYYSIPWAALTLFLVALTKLLLRFRPVPPDEPDAGADG